MVLGLVRPTVKFAWNLEGRSKATAITLWRSSWLDAVMGRHRGASRFQLSALLHFISCSFLEPLALLIKCSIIKYLNVNLLRQELPTDFSTATYSWSQAVGHACLLRRTNGWPHWSSNSPFRLSLSSASHNSSSASLIEPWLIQGRRKIK